MVITAVIFTFFFLTFVNSLHVRNNCCKCLCLGEIENKGKNKKVSRFLFWKKQIVIRAAEIKIVGDLEVMSQFVFASSAGVEMLHQSVNKSIMIPKVDPTKNVYYTPVDVDVRSR